MREPISITIEISGTPDKRLSPNSRTAGRTLSGLRRKARDHADQTCRAWRNNAGYFGDEPLIVGPASILVMVGWEKGRNQWDADNLTAALKSHVDSLQRTGIIDNDRHLVWQPVVQSRDPSGIGFIQISVTAIQEESKAA
jgi:hypothetical protein